MKQRESPLVAIVLYAFNEARFVEEAVNSLLTQDYLSMEVVLSDDGSSDGTWEIMQRIAAEYAGPHRILLNHNSINIGIGSQINSAVAMTSGELIVLANADDISHVDRVGRTVDAWLSANPRPSAVWSALHQIDELGRPLGKVMDMRVHVPDLATGARNRFSGGGAASLALDRRVFSEFGPLPGNLILEDSPLFARAVLLGSVKYLAEPLVDYRVHGENISQSYAVTDFDTWRIRNHRRVLWHKTEGVKAYLQILRDLHQKPASRWDPSDLAHAQWVGIEKLVENQILRDHYSAETFVGIATKLNTLLRLMRLLLKVWVKQFFPSIERRNERWHYRRVIESAKGKD